MESESAGPAKESAGDIEFPSLAEVLAATPATQPEPPLVSPGRLPIDQLDARMVERLVAEVAMRIDGLPHVRIYGRSGQAQGGLDLYAGAVDCRTVYQVKRVDRLTPAKLRSYVVEYAGPPRHSDLTPAPARRIEAVRYVLVTSASTEDTSVEDEFDALQHEYAGDLAIELWDGGELSRMLRDRGPLVAGVFGPDWARAFCGYHPPAGTPIPSGRALLNDPIVIHGLSAQRDRAASLAENDPAAAAELYGELAARLAEEGFAVLATQLLRRQRDLLVQAGYTDAALTATLELLLDAYDAGERSVHEVGPFSTLARLTEDRQDTLTSVSLETHESSVESNQDPASVDADQPVAKLPSLAEPTDSLVAALDIVATTITSWADQGYEVAPVADALQVIVTSQHALAARLVVAVAEQVIADDDPVDLTDGLRGVVADITATRPAGLVAVRLECALADLAIRASTPVDEAFKALLRDVRTGAIIDPAHAALALRRAAYAHAATGEFDEAVALFQEAVLAASEAHLGGDTRDSLRAIADLTPEMRAENDARTASTATGNQDRVLAGVDQACLSTLEHLADDHQHAALAKALFKARTWQRMERTNGAWLEEIIAHRRHAQVLLRASEPAAAIKPLIRARQHKLAAEAARGHAWCDVARFLRGNPYHRRAACAVAAVQADLTPDDRIDDLAAALVDLVETGRSNPAKDALRALAALGHRLPSALADRILELLTPSITSREAGVTHAGDQEVLTVLDALAAQHPSEYAADRASSLLVKALTAQVQGAADRLIQLEPVRIAEVEALADQDHRGAITVLAWWQHSHPSVADAARRGAHALLAHTIGPQATHHIGTAAQHHAQALRCALTHDIPEPRLADGSDECAEPLADLLTPVVRHLIQWAADPHSLAPSRAEALQCLRLLRDLVPNPDRAEVHCRLLAVNDRPDLSLEDLASQASTGPLNYFSFNLNSQHLRANALTTATFYATTLDEAAVITERLFTALRVGETDEQDATWRAETLQELERLQPMPLDAIVEHPAPIIRATVATVWSRREYRPLELAHRLAADPEPRVRLALARALAALAIAPPAEDAAEIIEILSRLATDASAAVRGVSMRQPGT